MGEKGGTWDQKGWNMGSEGMGNGVRMDGTWD